MLQQQLPQHLSHQLPSQQCQLACYLIKTRLRMLFPPLPHLLRTPHKLRFASSRFASSRFISLPLLLFSFPTPSLSPFTLAKILGCTPARTEGWMSILELFCHVEMHPCAHGGLAGTEE